MKLAFLTFFSYASAACVPVAPANQNLTLHLGFADFNNGSSVRVDMGPNSTLTVTVDTQGMGESFGLSVLPCAGTTAAGTSWSTTDFITRQQGDNFNGGYTHCFIGAKNLSMVQLNDLPYYCWRSFPRDQFYSALEDQFTGISASFEAVLKTNVDEAAVIYLVPSLGKTATSKRWLRASTRLCASNLWSWSDLADSNLAVVNSSVYEAWAIPYNASCPLQPNANYRCGLELFGMKVPLVASFSTSGPICHGIRNCTTGETGLSVGSYDAGIIATAPNGASESVFKCSIDVMLGDSLAPTHAPGHGPNVAAGSILKPLFVLTGVLAFWA